MGCLLKFSSESDGKIFFSRQFRVTFPGVGPLQIPIWWVGWQWPWDSSRLSTGASPSYTLWSTLSVLESNRGCSESPKMPQEEAHWPLCAFDGKPLWLAGCSTSWSIYKGSGRCCALLDMSVPDRDCEEFNDALHPSAGVCQHWRTSFHLGRAGRRRNFIGEEKNSQGRFLWGRRQSWWEFGGTSNKWI